jgi:tetraacyldisaccharide 4'-kinase
MPLSQDQFRAIISGRRRDATATVARSLLGVASLSYRLAVHIRNALFDLHLLSAHRVDAAVLSIGNLTTGGTGKTPLVVWLCQRINQKCRVAILTRGYKARSQETGVRSQNNSDEVAVLARACGGVPVIVNPDRVAGATTAIAQGARVLVLDDGFQHRRLARDLDIVAIDATLPFGYGRLLPAGLLREPMTGLSRAQAVVITRSDLVRPDQLAEIERTLRQVNPSLVIARAIHAPTLVPLSNNQHMSLADLAGRRVYAFCGIGNPKAFFEILTRLGADLVGSMAFDDHHACTQVDIQGIGQEAEAAKADLILTTEKNWLSLEPALFDGKVPVGYLEIQMELTAGEDGLIRLIQATLEGRITG